MKRTKKAIKNTIWSTISYIISMVLGLIVQPIFIQTLGTEYLGLSGLFGNIFSMISLVELGVGSSIVYHLYKPVAENDVTRIKSLMQFYKKCYRIVAALILLISLITLPFLPLIVGDTTIEYPIVVAIFLLFMLDIVCSYLLSYKRSILYATQNNYIMDISHIIYIVLLDVVQIIVLFATHDYVLYLAIKVIFKILENLFVTLYVNKKFGQYCGQAKALPKNVVKDIIKKVRGLLYHKIGVFLVAGTDNIIISMFLGVSTVGLYSNYNYIIATLNTAINQTFRSLISGVGNLIVTEKTDHVFRTYRRLNFLNLWFAIMATTGIYVVMESFISLWVGKEYILAHNVLVTLTVYEFVYLMKITPSIFKEGSGIFYEDRFVPILESVVNIGMSILLLQFFGLAGVFMGTICCHLITHVYTYPALVFKKVFHKKYADYFKIVIPELILAIICVVITAFISKMVVLGNPLLEVIKNILLTLAIPNIIIWIFYHEYDEYKYFKNMANKFLRKIKRN